MIGLRAPGRAIPATQTGMTYFLEFARLGFRSWQDEDLPLAMSLWGNSEVTKLIGGPFTPEMVQERLAGEIELGQECIGYGFGTLQADALFAGHHPANNASRQLLLRLGFVPCREELYPSTGLMHPSCWLRRDSHTAGAI